MKNIKKFLITVLSFLLLFAISCSNEGTTGGSDDDYYYNPGNNNNNNNNIIPPAVIPGRLTASAAKDITINIASQKVHSAGSISFIVRPYELQRDKNFSVSIENVAKATGNTSSLELTPTDFDSLTPTTKELTLSADGLTKVNAANGLADATAYKYDVTFKFTTTSDTVSNKTVSYTSTVSLYKLASVTKDMLETMIKATPKLTVRNRSGDAYDGFSDSFEVDFNRASLSSDLKTITFNSMGAGMTGPEKDSTYSPKASDFTTLRFGTADTRKFVANSYYKEPYTISGDGTSITFNYVFTLNSGYVLDDNISFITNTNEGLSIKVIFLNKGKWVDTI